VLREMLETDTARNLKGERIRLHSQLSADHAQAIYQTVLQLQPACVIEIGMACGTSSLAILAALRKLGGKGRLTSIDPYQTSGGGVGLAGVARANYQDLHTIIEKPDFLALPPLLEAGTKVDFAYIDGWHTFDYTLLDFFYLDKMLKPGGVVAFNDCGWKAVFKAIRWVMRHRKYAEVNAGLAPRVAKRQDVIGMFRGASPGLRLRMHQDRYFKKLEDWEPNYNFFSEF
jgi:predicted O-methyltransferase YrrM